MSDQKKPASEHISYEDAGVSTAASNAAMEQIRATVNSTRRSEVIGDLGSFGSMFSASNIKKMKDPVLISGTDGVGTKIKLAQRLGRNDTVGIDLVAMCANDVLAAGAEPLFFLDYIAIGHIDPEYVETIVDGVAKGCKMAGCALIGGETAEHPGVMEEKDYDLAGFCVGVADRADIIGPDKVRKGDVIIGLESSGIHSNGYSLVRKAMLDKMTDEELTAPNDDLKGKSIGDALLEPTRIYVKPVLQALRAGLPIHSAAHITGGGITENLARALPTGLDAEMKLGSWPEPKIVRMLLDASHLTLEEQLRTLNSGIGMCLICSPDYMAEIVEHFAMQGEKPYIVGNIIEADDPEAAGKVVYTDVETGERVKL